MAIASIVYILIQLFALNASVNAEVILVCGTQPYYASAYTCYDGFLCPIMNGEATIKCGNACYSPAMYTCTNGALSLAPKSSSTLFTLTARSTTSLLSGRAVNACGQRFVVGPGATGSCTYCPDSVAQTGTCAQNSNTTIIAGSSLFVEVPGGQAIYVVPTSSPIPGLLSFTQAHSAFQPAGASQSFGSSSTPAGFDYIYTGPSSTAFNSGATTWVACPTGTSGSYSIYARIKGQDAVYTKNLCVGLELGMVDSPSGLFGAWQFT